MWKRMELKEYVYDFSVDYNAIEVAIVDIHKYLMKNNGIV